MVAHLARPVATNPSPSSKSLIAIGLCGAASAGASFVQIRTGSHRDQQRPTRSTLPCRNQLAPKVPHHLHRALPGAPSNRLPPPESETPFRAKLAASDSTHTGISCSNRLRFTFLTPPTRTEFTSRAFIWTAATSGRHRLDCVTTCTQSLLQCFVSLPNLANVPDGAVYGTCDIARAFSAPTKQLHAAARFRR